MECRTARTSSGDDRNAEGVREGNASAGENRWVTGMSNHPVFEGSTSMAGTTNKAKNTTQRAKGKVKEAAGKATGNEGLQRKGKTDQTKGNLKQAGENVKEAVRRK
jgi:uncharacterized protein YjbJ (UPF0337 family)